MPNRETPRALNGESNPGPYGILFRELLEQDDRFFFLLDNPPRVFTRMKAILGNAMQRYWPRHPTRHTRAELTP